MERSETRSRKVFLSGVFFLTVSTVSVKIIGFLYKIPMLSYLGSEGMGYFHSAYEIYMLFCMIATAGLPVALSVLVSGAAAKGDRDAVRKIYRTALWTFLFIGTVGSILMSVFAKSLCHWIRSEHAYGCMIAISPTVFFVCLSSALRGYFQGFQKMLPTALSQLLEAAGKLIFGVLFAKTALENGAGTETVAAAAGWGLTLGSALSALWLCAEKQRFRKKEEDSYPSGSAEIQPPTDSSYPELWRQLFLLSVPMTLGASLTGFTKLIDMTMILRRLQDAGYTEALANTVYGSYTTLALSVYGLLPTLVNAVALPLVPMLSAAIAEGDTQRQTELLRLSLRLTTLFAVHAALGIAACAEPILTLLFGIAPDAVRIASPLLSALGASVFFSCMITCTNSVLHAHQIVNRPILALLLGAAIKIPVAYLLIGNGGIGIMGAPLSSLACNLTIVLLNVSFCKKFLGEISAGEVFLRPLTASVAAVGISYALYRFLAARYGTGALLTVLILLMTVSCYLLCAFATGSVRREDLSVLSPGKRKKNNTGS